MIVLFATDLTLSRTRELFRLGVYDCEIKYADPTRTLELVERALRNTVDATLVAWRPTTITFS